ncbi:MAG TPA: outer membrane beta-barrel protein [Holophagaceae bacterium]
MKMLSRPILAAFALATLAHPLGAESPHFGIQGLANAPLGDLKDFVDDKPGLGAGIHGTFDLGLGNMLRPRLDYNDFPEATLSGIKNGATCLGLGVDYLYFVAGKPEGFYLTGGVAVNRWSFSTEAPGTAKATHTTTKPGLALGAGIQWTEAFGTEARFITTRISQDFSAESIQIGATLRF